MPTPLVHLMSKYMHNHPYAMLSIWLGHFEFLVIGGFRGALDDNSIIPFLGPTINNMSLSFTTPGSSTSIRSSCHKHPFHSFPLTDYFIDSLNNTS